MATVTTSTADPLGAPTSEYRARYGCGMIALALLAVYGVFLAVLGATLVAQNFPLWGRGMLFFLGLLVVTLPSVLGLRHLWKRRDNQVLLCTNGLCIREQGVEKKVLWEEIDALYENIQRIDQAAVFPSDRPKFSIVTRDGTEIAAPGVRDGLNLVTRVRVETIRRLLPRALQSLRHGEWIDFNGWELSQHGIRHQNQLMTWDQSEGTTVDKGLLHLWAKTNQVRLSSVLTNKKLGKKVAFIATEKMPNVFLFVILTEALAGGEPGALDKLEQELKAALPPQALPTL